MTDDENAGEHDLITAAKEMQAHGRGEAILKTLTVIPTDAIDVAGIQKNGA